jgi:hypothetical protein
MNIASTVKQNVKRPHLSGTIRNVLHFEDIEPADSNAGPLLSEGRKRGIVDVGCPHHRSLVGKRDRRGPPNALPRGRNQRYLSCKSSAHFLIPVSSLNCF